MHNSPDRLRCAGRLLVLLALVTLTGPRSPAAEWQQLFDGRTLDGWEQLGGKARFMVRDGAIVGASVSGTPNSFLCTKKHYGDFILELEFKVDPRLNSGIQIRSQTRERNPNRVYGYQVEIDSTIRSYSGGIFDEGRRGWLKTLQGQPEAMKALRWGKWNHLRIQAVGDHIQTWINDTPAADLRDAMDLTGFIGLQVHSHASKQPLKVAWRNLRLQDLGRHEWKPLFDGESLEGWHALPGGEWKVVEGVIVGTSAADEPRHGLLVSDQRFKDFTVRCKFRVLEGDSGFYFRVDEVPGAVGVHGFQVEIDTTYETGGLYETGGRAWVVQHPANQRTQWYQPGEWNDLMVSAHGDDVVVRINHQVSARLTDDPGRREGHLALQLHGGQAMHVEYKDIDLLVPAQAP